MEQGAEAVVLAGTDLGLAFDRHDPGYPVIDARGGACGPFLGTEGVVRGWGLVAALLAGPALAEDPYHPAAQCAAFWLGRDDYARASTFLDVDPTDLVRAAAFRAVAVRLAGEAGPIDTFLQKERRAMARLVEAYIYGGDETSRDLHDRLLETCAAYAATQGETRDLS